MTGCGASDALEGRACGVIIGALIALGWSVYGFSGWRSDAAYVAIAGAAALTAGLVFAGFAMLRCARLLPRATPVASSDACADDCRQARRAMVLAEPGCRDHAAQPRGQSAASARASHLSDTPYLGSGRAPLLADGIFLSGSQLLLGRAVERNAFASGSCTVRSMPIRPLGQYRSSSQPG